MMHWDKKATEFDKLEWDSVTGLPVVREIPFVQTIFEGIQQKERNEK